MDLKILDKFKSIKFGPGVVSKLVLALYGVAACAATLGFSTGDLEFKYVMFAGILLCFLVVAGLSVFFVERHPEAALVEGAEVVMVYQLQAEAKNLRATIIQDDVITSSPMRALPAVDDADDAEVGNG